MTKLSLDNNFSHVNNLSVENEISLEYHLSHAHEKKMSREHNVSTHSFVIKTNSNQSNQFVCMPYNWNTTNIYTSLHTLIEIYFRFISNGRQYDRSDNFPLIIIFL